MRATWRSPRNGYLVALVTTAVVVMLRLALADWLHDRVPLLLPLVVVVFLAAWCGGLKPGLLEAGPRLRAGVDSGKHGMPWEVQEQLLTGEWARNSAFGLREQNHFTAVGGRSLCWAGHRLRSGPKDYREWPISYEEMAPYYSKDWKGACNHPENQS